MTLQHYYESLPGFVDSKKNFIDRVSERCNVSRIAARFWAKGIRRPSNPEHLIILSEETGIPVENLWNDETN